MTEVIGKNSQHAAGHPYDVYSLAENHGVNLVSAVRSYGHLGPFRPRPGVDFRGVRLFDILLRQEQIICSSTVTPGDTSQNLYGRWGVVIGSGAIEQAFPYDATTAVVDNQVTSIFLDRIEHVDPAEQIASAIHARALYNEVNVHADTIAGVYYCVNQGEDPAKLDLPSPQTQHFINKLEIPKFLLQNGTFHALESIDDPVSSKESILSPTDVLDHRATIDEGRREELVSYLVNNLVLAPRNAVSSGLSRGNFAHEYRQNAEGPYHYEDFLFEQSQLIDPAQRPSLRLYGAVALHQFARRAEEIDTQAATRARRMAKSVLTSKEFLDYSDRVEPDGHFAIQREELEHYLSTGNLPDHLSDH